MNAPFDTQKIRLELAQEIIEAQKQADSETDVEKLLDLAGKIQWLKSKLQFLGSSNYYERKMQS